MKNFLLCLTNLIIIKSFSICVINCNVRYLYRVYHQNDVSVGTYYGSEIGSNTIYAPPAASLYQNNKTYEDIWSKTYSINVTFLSGYEANESLGESAYNEHSIIAVIKWSNGGSSCIILSKWVTNMKYINEQEVMYSNATSELIKDIYGKDKKDVWWEINFN